MSFIKVENLRPGDGIKFTEKQRKFHLIKSISELGPNQPKQFIGKILLVTEDCKTIALEKSHQVIKQ